MHVGERVRSTSDAANPMSPTFDRTEAFCRRFGLQVPILLAPMAGVSSPSLSIAVANAGGLGSCGALLMQPDEIIAWAAEVRANSNGAFNLNLLCPLSSRERATARPRHELGARGCRPVIVQR